MKMNSGMNTSPLIIIRKLKKLITCITETNDIADPVSDGGDDNLVFGLAEYADGEADRTFRT